MMKKILNFMIVTILVAVSLTFASFAAVDEDHAEMVLNLTPVEGQTDIYELTATCSAMSTMQSVELTFTYDSAIFTPVNASTYKTIAVAALRKQAIAMVNDPAIDWPFTLQISNFTDNDDGTVTLQIVCTADMDVRDYYSYTDFTIFKVAFKITAENVAALTTDQFYVNQIFMSVQNDTEGVENHRYGYKYEVEVPGVVNLINNVAAEPEPIVISVLKDDIIYLQDGTVETATETTDAYEVPDDIGYVAVNTGKTAQATWYVDGTTATQVHVNGVVGSDELAIRANGLDDVDANNKVRSGLRFKMSHNPTTRKVAEGEKAGVANERDVVTEVGFLMTAEVSSVVAQYGESPVLTMEMYKDGKNLVKKGPAYSKDDNINIFMTSEDETMIITGVFYGVPLTTTNVQTKIISRPYYIVNGSVIYGEQTESTLYKEARRIYNGEGFDSLEAYAKGYIEEIVGLVDPTIVEEEIIIDVGELYEALAALE